MKTDKNSNDLRTAFFDQPQEFWTFFDVDLNFMDVKEALLNSIQLKGKEIVRTIMKRWFFIIIIIASFKTYGQIYSDCFKVAKDQSDLDLQNQKQVKIGDTIEFNDKKLKILIGCKFPYAPLRAYDNEDINPIKFKTDFVIINFNYLYCDYCTQQIEYLVKLKKSSKKTITIISLFKEKTGEIQHLIEKYKSDVYFVSDATDWIKAYNLNCGFPLNYILDRNKFIQYAKGGTSYDYSKWYLGLLKIIDE